MNRSEELAKLLGIKPKISCKLQCVGSKGVDKNGEVMCINNCSKSGLLYPNFTKPDNFVKLLKINFDIDLVLGIDNIEDNFIETLISILPHMYEYDVDGLNTIKQQAQQTDWTY